MNQRNRLLVLFAHPAFHKSRVNRQLIRAIEDVEDITLHNLYEEYPDFHIDVNREQELLLEHDVYIWQHPFYWYSSPSIIKEWIDLVLKHGFAYGRSGTALKGKWIFSAITAGGRKEVYQEGNMNNFTIPQFLAPFRQTAQLCNMVYMPPFVVHGTHLLSDEEILQAATDYRRILISVRDQIFSTEEIWNCSYMNDLLELSTK
jgi:glutathione-regulated potassium-efflux system ancillary protein KefG